MRSFCAALGLFCVFALPAVAQTALSLSAQGSVVVAPDEVVASLSVQVNAKRAPEAAALVNAAMAKALTAARAVVGGTAATADYQQSSTNDENGHVTGYTASQTLNLTMPAPGGVPPAGFTALVGDLQAEGLLLNSLDGALSDAGQRQARAAAITDAVRRLQADAGTVAAALGDKVQGIKTLRLDMDNPPPIVPGRMMMAAIAAPPPQAAPGPVTVSASVTGEVALGP
jgi:uncharacterized protein YggE